MSDLAGIRYGAEITAAAQRYGLDPRLLAGVAAQETGGPGASSGSNIVGDGGHGHGLFQIDDRSWAFAGTPAAMDPAQNADIAAQILSRNLAQYGGNVKAALSAYNAGSPAAIGTTTTWSDGKTLGYADSVLRHVAELGGSTGQLAAEAPYTSASVNALANYSATTASEAPVSGAATSAGTGSVDPSELEAMLSEASSSSSSSASSSSQFTPVRTWASMTSGQSGSGGAQAGNAADQGMADILDQQSVFGDDGSDDA
jgi:hypothetical protein